MASTVPDIDPDMIPSTGKTMRDMIGAKHKEEPKDAPKPRAATNRAPTQKQQEATFEQMQEDLQTAYEFLASILVVVSPNGAVALEERAEKCAETWVNQARKSPRVYRFLTNITEGSGWVAIALVHAPIAMAITHDLRVQQAGGDPQSMQEQYEQFMQATQQGPDGPPSKMETVG